MLKFIHTNMETNLPLKLLYWDNADAINMIHTHPSVLVPGLHRSSSGNPSLHESNVLLRVERRSA